MVRVPPPTLASPPVAKMAIKSNSQRIRPSISRSLVTRASTFTIADDDGESYLTSIDLRRTPKTALRPLDMNTTDLNCCKSDITLAPCSELAILRSASQLSEADRMIYETPTPRYSPIKNRDTIPKIMRSNKQTDKLTSALSREGWLTEGETIAVAIAAEDREFPMETFLLGKVRSVGRESAHIVWRQQIWRSGRLTGLFKRSRYTKGTIEYSNRYSIILRSVSLLPLDHSPTGAKWLMFPEEYDECRKKVIELETSIS